jgi:hypothetical protein
MRSKKRTNTSLGNGITTDVQLAGWGHKHIPGFRGVYSRDEISRICPMLRAGESVILNLDPRYSRGGSHWVALRVSSEAPIVYYKDSFGAPPPDSLDIACSGRGILYGNRVYQKITEQNCGQRALRFLSSMQRAAEDGREIEWFRDSEVS